MHNTPQSLYSYYYMFRTSVIEGIIIKTSRVGEIHKGITLFSGKQGILSLIAHGAYKTRGKLRSHTELFTYIRAYVYHEKAKDNYKLTDVECLNAFPSVRRSVSKYFTASLVAEITLKSFGGGESYRPLFGLVKDVFHLLDTVGSEKEIYLIIQFIVRFLHLTGFAMDFSVCASCGSAREKGEALFYLPRSTAFLCGRCADEHSIMLSAGVVAYLEKTEDLNISDAVNIQLAKGAAITTRQMLYLMVQAVLEKPLLSLETGGGIL